MKQIILALFIFLIAGLWTQKLYAQFGGSIDAIQPAGFVVVELFTSQSCSSCPPADKVLAKLAQIDNVITLGCHVTYWDHLSWKDTLSQEFCTAHQREYASFRGTGRVYTPQMVVNGTEEFVGSRRAQALGAVAKAKPLAEIKLAYKSGALTAQLPALPEGQYKLILFTTLDDHAQKISSGENRGKTLHYTSPVETMQDLGYWNGEEGSKIINTQRTENLFILLGQSINTGKIIAAGKL